MSICQASVELSNYLDSQEKALKNFTSCLPEYRDNVANEVMALLDGEKTDEEFWDVFTSYDGDSEIIDILAIRVLTGFLLIDHYEIARKLIKEALEYYSEVLYNCSLDEMLEDNDGTTLESWIESVL